MQLTANKWTKKCDARAKLLFCPVKLLFIIILVAAASLTCYYLRYIVMSQKQRILGANWIAPADSKRFFDSSIVPSFLVREVENKSFPCSHKLGERTGQVWQDNSRRVRTHEKNSGETVRRLGTIIQSIFCAQSGAGIRLNFWKQFGEGRFLGALSPVLENFRRALSSDPIDCPLVSEDGGNLDLLAL